MLVGCLEVLLKGGELRTRLLQFVDRDRVRHCLDQSAILARCDDIERLQPKFEAMLVKDIFELRNHLGGKLLLLKIVSTFYDATDQAKARLVTQSTEGILLCNFHAHFIERLLPK